MADLVQTASLVIAQTGAQVIDGTSFQVITAGNLCYQAGNGLWGPASAGAGNAVVAGSSGCRIALNTAPGANQPVRLCSVGNVALGNTTLTIGQVYALSPNAGRIAPYSDLGTGNFVTILGVASDGNSVVTPNGGIFVSGVQKA